MVDIVIQFKNGKTISFIEEEGVWEKLKEAILKKHTLTINEIWFIDCEEITCMWRKGA